MPADHDVVLHSAEAVPVLFYVCLCAGLLCLACALVLCLKVQVAGYRGSRHRAFCDLLDYATLADDSVIVLKSGALLQIFELRPEDLRHAETARLKHVHELVTRSVHKLGGNWCVQVDAVRGEDLQYLPENESGHPLVRVLDRLRARTFRHDKSFRTRIFLSLCFAGNSQTQNKLEALMVQEQQGNARMQTLKLIETFKEQCDSVVSTLRLTMQVRLLTFAQDSSRHEALTFIHQCITGLDHAIAVPQSAVYLDTLLSTQDFAGGFCPCCGENNIACVAVDGLPSEAWFGVLNALALLPCACRFHTRFIVMDYVEATLVLEKYRRQWAQKSRGLIAQIFNIQNARVNEAALERVMETDESKKRLEAGEESFGSYTALVVLMDRDFDRLQQQAHTVLSCLEELGFGGRIETVNAVEAYLGSLPGHLSENLRRPLVSSRVLSDLLPLSLPWEGEREAPSPLLGAHKSPLMQVRTAGQGRFYLNLHEQDLGNTIVIGPPGAGKSVLLGELMLNFLRYAGARVFAFDKGWSFYALTRAAGGEHIVLENVRSAFCPLQDLADSTDFDYACSFVDLLCRLSGHSLTPQERIELINCLRLLAERDISQRTLSDLLMLLSSEAVKNCLVPYTVMSSPDAILDSTHNLDFRQNLTVFECGQIFESPQRFSLPVLRQLFRLIEKSFDGSPCAIVLDEAWMMLQDEVFAAELLKWFKTLRKRNVMVILATQSLMDLARSSLFETFLECAKTRIFLPNYDAGSNVLRPVYEQMGLNEAQVNTLVQAVPKRDYLLKKGADSMVFALDLSPEEKKLLSFAGDHCVSVVDGLLDRYGPGFFLNTRAEQEAYAAALQGRRYSRYRAQENTSPAEPAGAERRAEGHTSVPVALPA